MPKILPATLAVIALLCSGCATMKHNQSIEEQLQDLEVAYITGEIDGETYEASRAELIEAEEHSLAGQSAAFIGSFGSTGTSNASTAASWSSTGSLYTISAPRNTVGRISPSD